MAWLAVHERVPRPGSQARGSGDVQSLFVLPEHRGHGYGAALLQPLLATADRLGLEHVTVHANQRSLTLYERNGFPGTGTLLIRHR